MAITIYLVERWIRELDHESIVEAHRTQEAAEARVASLRSEDPEEDEYVYGVSAVDLVS